MVVLKLDELAVNKRRSKPYSEYFGEMRISKVRKDRRKRVAEDIEDAMLTYMETLLAAEQYGMLEVMAGSVTDEYKQRYIEAARSHAIADTYILAHADDYVDGVRENTTDAIKRLSRAEQRPSQGSDDDEVDSLIALRWYLSEDRAILNGEDQANYILDHTELVEALENGYTKKGWLSMRDRRVRDTHREVDGTVLPIEEPFEVGGYLMMTPKDDSMGAPDEEIANCRCSLEFYR